MFKKSNFIDHPQALHFQIQFTDKDGGGTFRYFSVMLHKEIGSTAEAVANIEYLQKGYENQSFRMSAFRPMRSAKVVEYDREKKEPLRGGIKFKIRLSFVEATFGSGRRERKEWYKADDIEVGKTKAKA